MTKESILNFSQTKAEPLWLQERRLTAFDNIDKLTLPEINRVKFHRWNLGDGTISEDQALANVPDFTALGDNPKLVQVGTQTVLEQLPTDLINKGVIFTDFYTALEEIPDYYWKVFLEQRVIFKEDKLAAYHTAYFNSAAVLYVPDNIEIEEPIEGLFYQDKASDVPFNKHILIIAGRNSRINYLERFETIGEGDAQATANISVEVIALDDSQIKFSAIDRLGENVTTYISRRARHGKDASVDWHSVSWMKAMLSLISIQICMEMVAMPILKLLQHHQDVKSKVWIHVWQTTAANSIGHILQHGVILERGTLTFNGIGHIIKGAKGADAQQESHVLMLSDKARSDANPICLIDEMM